MWSVQLWCHIDAFSVETELNHARGGKKVFVKEHEVLPLNYQQQMKGGTSGLHLVYFCITIRGAGTIALLMSSGTKNLPRGRGRLSSMKFWFERLQEFGIGSKEDEEMLKELHRKGFKVCASCIHTPRASHAVLAAMLSYVTTTRDSMCVHRSRVN